MGTGYHGGFGQTKGAANPNNATNESEASLKFELRSKKIKFNEADMVFVTRDGSGQIVWLEKGNSSVGLNHILDEKDGCLGHVKDFEQAFGVCRNHVGFYLKKVIQKGTVVSNRTVYIGTCKKGYERVYEYKSNHYIVTGIDINGFIVLAYPIRKDEACVFDENGYQKNNGKMQVIIDKIQKRLNEINNESFVVEDDISTKE